MRVFLLSAVLIITICFGFNQLSYAACPEGPPNTFNCNTINPNPDPDGIQQPTNNNNLTITVNDGAGIDTSLQPGLDLDAMDLGNGDNTITVNGGTVIGQDYGVDTANGNKTLTIIDAIFRGITNNAVQFGGSGQDTINIHNSLVTSVDNDVINTTDDDDIVNVIDSQILVLTASGGDSAISVGDENDTVSVEHSVIRGGRTGGIVPTAIFLGGGDDTLTLGTGADLRGIIDGGIITNGRIVCSGGDDTIIFAMQVRTSRFAEITEEIESKDPEGDSITINGLFYEWINCEELVTDLQPGLVSPVPTLSEWGLIAMAGLLGIVGFMVVRRRQVTT